jgi:hypothetical protein
MDGLRYIGAMRIDAIDADAPALRACSGAWSGVE